ncbi:MAG: DsrE/DsrF/DrsH-like family protein, partial [Desulfobacterales bacterium]
MEILEQRIKNLEKQIEDIKRSLPQDQLSMVVFSGDLDRMLAAFIIAVGAAAMFERVVIFFTFWGIPAMRDIKKHVKKADAMASMFDKMLPKGSSKLKLSQMHMAGMVFTYPGDKYGMNQFLLQHIPEETVDRADHVI